MENEAFQPSATHAVNDSFFSRSWPYVVMMLLALVGVAATGVERRDMTTYWVVLTPVFAMLSLYIRWQGSRPGELKWSFVGAEITHWLAVMVAVYLIFVSAVRQMMNADATALMILTVLALGTFTSGVHAGAWRMCFVGFALALGVPIIAWIDEASLIFVLVGLVFVLFLLFLVFYRSRA